MAKTSGAFRAGRVVTPDAKWTGEEPDWHGWESWPIEKFMKERMRMLKFYGYYLAQADLKPAVLDYMKRKGYSKTDISLVRGANPNVMPTTIGKLVRAMDKGMPSIHPDAAEYFAALPFSDPEFPPVPKDDHDVIRAELKAVTDLLRKEVPAVAPTAEEKAKAPTPNPTERLRQKVDKEIISKLDEMLDEWIAKSDDAKVAPLALTSYVRDGNIPAAGCRHIVDWLNKQLDELKAARDKTCPQMVEGYEYLSKPALRNRISNLEGMLAEVTKITSVAKTMRKVRVKKPKDATKQVSRLKYQETSKEYDLTSINPARIPTSHRVYVFNTKYRTLGVYIASGPAGFEVKGASLKGFCLAESYITSLRKPKEVLDFLVTSTPKQIDKYLATNIKSKKRKGNGRINAQTILLRVIENRL